jgi:hypothetical protein
MRLFTTFLAASTLILCVVTFARADEVLNPVKWSQLPEMGPYGYNFSSETSVPSMAADDFLCWNEFPVVDVHWWGSYYAPALWPYPNSDNHVDPTIPTGTPPGILAGFRIEFYTDVPAGVDPLMPWSHPGLLLYDEFIPIDLVSEAYYGTVTHLGGILENVWQYNVDLPVPFFQDPGLEPQDVDGDGVLDGTVYWLKIQAVHSDQQIQWGWHQAETLWHDNAVQQWPPNPTLPEWNALADTDLAFELTIIPEPSLLLVVGFGALLVLRRRK